MDLRLALSVLEQGLKLWNHREASRYLNEVISLKQDYFNELNRKDRSDLALDKLSERMRIIAETFATAALSNGNDSSSSSK